VKHVSFSQQLAPWIIEDLIIRHNKDLVKDPLAVPDDLILADNEVSITVQSHLGTLTAVIGYGSYGSGKTWTCYKIFHELKQRQNVYITYVPVRAYRSVRGAHKKTLNSRGVASLVATAIAEALIAPQSLRQAVTEVLTNASNVPLNIDIGGPLESVLANYHDYLAKTGGYHIVLLDEVDEGFESIEDIEALVDAVYALRKLYDRDRVVRIMIVALMAPVKARSLIIARQLPADMLERSIYTIFEERFKERAKLLSVTAPYEALAVLGVDLDNPRNLQSMLIGFVRKSIDVINRKLGINVKVEGIENAIDLLVQIWPSMRWCQDILRRALALAAISAIQAGQANLLNFVFQALTVSLGLDVANVRKVFIEGHWTYAKIPPDEALNSLKITLVDRLIKAACDSPTLNCFPEYDGMKREPGFASLFYRIKKIIEERRGRERGRIIRSKNIVFWLRLSDLDSDAAVNKAKRIFGDSYVVIIMPDKAFAKRVPENTLLVIKLPSPLIYYILATSTKAIDSKLKELYEDILATLISKEYLPELTRLLGELFA
jgi:hypothetical protein